jgi:hypothetical protein
MAGFLRVALLGIALTVVACTRYADIGTDTIGPGYATGGGEWDSGGGITIVVRAFERGDATVVCGAWATDQQSALSANMNFDVMEVGSIYIGRHRIVQNLVFMARVPYSDNISGGQANCVASTVPWRAEFAENGPRLRIPRMAYPQDGGDEDSGGGGDSLVFRETARPEIVR